MKEDVSHYHRIESDHKDKSYRFLRGCIDKYLNRKQQEKHRNDNRQLVTSKAFQPLKLSAPAVGKAGKGKGKGGSDSSAPKQEPKAKTKYGSPRGKGAEHKIPTGESGVPYCRFFH